MTSQQKIIDEYLVIRNFNKMSHLNGWCTDKQFDKAQRETWIKYADKLSDGRDFSFAMAGLQLLEAEYKQDHSDQDRFEAEEEFIKEQEGLAVDYN